MRDMMWALASALAAVQMAAADDYTVRFNVQLDSSRTGSFQITVREAKAPLGAERFRQLVHSGFFNGCRFYRMQPGFMVQFGLNGNLTMQHEWDANGLLRDERHIAEPDWNMRGTISFVQSTPNSRSTQLFINFDDNHQLDKSGAVPFGRVVSGWPTLNALYSGYRERPQLAAVRSRGDAYLQAEFPRLSYITAAQQVAFVEEPVVLSKNFTGFLITVGMVIAAALCCGVLRFLQHKAEQNQSKQDYGTPPTDETFEGDMDE